MSDLGDLYQELILEHSDAPRNFRSMDTGVQAEGYNPLCGDHFTVYLDMDGEVIRDVSFQGTGCAISKASASMMTQAVKGKTKAEAEELFSRFHGLVTGQSEEGGAPEEGAESGLGKLAVFAGVSQFPVRVKCASLAWHTLRAALEGKQSSIITE